MAHMGSGDFHAAWELSDRVLAATPPSECRHWPLHLRPIWDGRPLQGRVLVRCHHGLGDTVQFVRFCRPLAESGCQVTLLVQPELLDLVREAPGVHAAFPLSFPDPEFDVEIEVMELAYALRASPQTLPSAPYLRAASGQAAPAPRPGIRVGLVWQAGAWDPRRSLPTSLVAEWARSVPVEWWVLQRGEARADWPANLGRLLDAPAPADLARVLSDIDLLLSVDSFPAHLAGALGRPVWTLLPTPCDWRWQNSGESTPWYPSMKLLRCQGGWIDLLNQTAARLATRGVH